MYGEGLPVVFLGISLMPAQMVSYLIIFSLFCAFLSNSYVSQLGDINPVIMSPSSSSAMSSPGFFASVGSTYTADTSRTLVQELDVHQKFL